MGFKNLIKHLLRLKWFLPFLGVHFIYIFAKPQTAIFQAIMFFFQLFFSFMLGFEVRGLEKPYVQGKGIFESDMAYKKRLDPIKLKSWD